MTKTKAILFALLHKAIDKDFKLDEEKFVGVDWQAVFELAASYGVHFIAFDALESLPSNCRPDRHILIQWYGQLPEQEDQYGKKWAVACELAAVWGKQNISATILKGRSIAQFYPTPSHRFSCDLDVFIGDGWSDACSILEKHGIKLEYEVYKEAEFTYKGVYVECHRYITPVRGNETLHKFELYLRHLLASGEKTCFEGSVLVKPSLMFVVMLFIEHALWDYLHRELSLKHVVDWMVLRKQDINWQEFNERCKEFKFDRFLSLIESMAKVIEDKVKYESLPSSYREAFDELFVKRSKTKGQKSWFKRRVTMLWDIIRCRKRFAQFGYCSMSNFLFNSLWAHFFKKEVEL